MAHLLSLTDWLTGTKLSKGHERIREPRASSHERQASHGKAFQLRYSRVTNVICSIVHDVFQGSQSEFVAHNNTSEHPLYLIGS